MQKHRYSFLLDTYDILYAIQFGFREKHSTTQAILSLTCNESIKNSIGNGKYGCGIFLDLQKVFDVSVNHDILVTKMEHCEIRGNVLSCFNPTVVKDLNLCL